MATPNPRNLVLLLSSGHTVRIALRDDDLTGNGGPTGDEVRELLTDMPSVVVGVFPTWEFAYVENTTLPEFREGSSDLMPNDYQRITVEGPGTVVQYG